jgi:N-acetylmuramate 1-kinase
LLYRYNQIMQSMEPALRRWTGSRLAERGLSLADCQSLAVEASHRRFYRLRLGPASPGASLVVMSSPPALERNDAFEHLAGVFSAYGIGVPEIVAVDRARGFVLMSDLGELHLAEAYADPGVETVMPGAIDTLMRLQQVHDADIAPYTRQRFADELDIYRDWCLGALLERDAPGLLDDAFAVLLAATDAQPRCCVHRDFHCRNLLWRPGGGIGVVDFQDALMGPATYDLASLLRDCYHRFDEAAVARWRDEYLARTPLPVDRSTFARDMDLVALQRQLKAVGIFARLMSRDGRDSHAPHIVPVLERIRDLAASYPELAPLARHAGDVAADAGRRMESSS